MEEEKYEYIAHTLTRRGTANNTSLSGHSFKNQPYTYKYVETRLLSAGSRVKSIY